MEPLWDPIPGSVRRAQTVLAWRDHQQKEVVIAVMVCDYHAYALSPDHHRSGEDEMWPPGTTEELDVLEVVPDATHWEEIEMTPMLPFKRVSERAQ